MKVARNVDVLRASEKMFTTKNSLDSSMEKLATGLKVNKASDNASGLAIADKLRTQISSIDQSYDNAISGVMLTQIADKAINEQSTMLDTIKQKLIQANTSTTSDEGRKSIAKDIVKLVDQIDEIASTTNYNGSYLLQKDRDDTSASEALEFQVGELNTHTIELENEIVQANSIGYNLSDLKNVDIENGMSMDFAAQQMAIIDDAVNTANLFRSDFGMIHNQLKSASRNLNAAHTNLSNAESVIRDTDYSKESAEFSKNNIIHQSGSFAMSQARDAHQKTLDLVA